MAVFRVGRRYFVKVMYKRKYYRCGQGFNNKDDAFIAQQNLKHQVKAKNPQTTEDILIEVNQKINQILPEENPADICFICHKIMTIKSHRMDTAVRDHCHKTGQLRGLICNACNLMLGRVQDDEMVFIRAIAYLRKTQKDSRIKIIELKPKIERGCVNG